MREALKITKTMLDCNAMAKNLYKGDYQEKSKMFRDILSNYQKANGCEGILDALNALLKLESTEESKFASMMFISVTVDVITEKETNLP